MLVNLTNHPSTRWSAEQMDAATKTYGRVVDLPHPTIDPAADEAEVFQVAKSFVERAKSIIYGPNDQAHEANAVHLMGEASFTAAFLVEWSDPCTPGPWCPLVVSTTRRQDDGKFTFVQFRTLPSILG